MYSVAGILRMIAEVFLTLHLTVSRPAYIQARAGSSGSARHDAPTRPIAPNFRFASLSPSAKENLSANHDNSEPILGAAQRQPATCSSKGCGRLSARSRSLQRSQLAGSFTRGSKPPTATLIATAAQSRLSDTSRRLLNNRRQTRRLPSARAEVGIIWRSSMWITPRPRSAALMRQSISKPAANRRLDRPRWRRWCSTASRAGIIPHRFAASSTRIGVVTTPANFPSPVRAKLFA